jgi:DNA-binding PadR family transcriptional regulator
MFKSRIHHGMGFFHGPPMHHPFQKGDLKYVILSLILDKPRYGYEVMKALEEKSCGFYTPSPGVVYPTLQMLEEMGYASATERDDRKVYSITEEGKKFLAENQDLADAVHQQMRHHWGDKGKMQAMGKVMEEVMKFRQLMWRKLHGADPAKIEEVRQVLARAYDEIEAILK